MANVLGWMIDLVLTPILGYTGAFFLIFFRSGPGNLSVQNLRLTAQSQPVTCFLIATAVFTGLLSMLYFSLSI